MLMQVLDKADALALVAAQSNGANTEARDAIVDEIREAGATAARFTLAELRERGIAPQGSKGGAGLRGAKTGPIEVVRTFKDGTVLVVLR
jgi:hypothetical protein